MNNVMIAFVTLNNLTCCVIIIIVVNCWLKLETKRFVINLSLKNNVFARNSILYHLHYFCYMLKIMLLAKMYSSERDAS